MPEPTPSQTIGPFLHIALAGPIGLPEDAPGRITVSGTLTDGDGAPVSDGLIETWQCDGVFTRCATDADGRWQISTRKPPAAPTVGGALQAPHLLVSVFARGLLNRVMTRIYFAGDEAAHATDPVLATIEPERRARLVAAPGYRFDIRLQGEGESVFFDG